MKTRTWKWIALSVAAVLVGVDQYIKYIVEKNLSDVSTLPLIRGVFHLTYLQNDTLVFGLGSGLSLEAKIRLMLIISLGTAVLLGGLLWFFFTKWIRHPFLIWSVALIISGGFGNLIDRLFRHYVIDYLDFRLINFYVFNFADCCVVIGTIAVVIYLLFLDGKEEKDSGKNEALPEKDSPQDQCNG